MKNPIRTTGVLALVALAALTAYHSGAPAAALAIGCDDMDAHAAAFAPLEFDLDHVVTAPHGVVDPLNRAAWIDSIFNNSAFLDTVPAGTFTVAEFIKNRPDFDMSTYRAWLDTLVHDGDDVCEVVWTLHGTAVGDTTFSTFGISRAGTAVFEPLMYFHPTEVILKQADKESGGTSGSTKNGFGMTTTTWTITVAIKCENCRIIDPGPYTAVSTWSIFLWSIKYDFIEGKYFETAPCCPDDKRECVKSVVKIAVTSGGKSSVTIKHKDWIEVQFEGWFGCTAEYPYTFHVCCDKVMTTKTTTSAAVPTREFHMGEEVCVAGDNLPPYSMLSIAVFPNYLPLHQGMPIPPSMPGTATRLFTDPMGQVVATDLGAGRPVLMPFYQPWPEPTFDLGYDFIVDINENGIWDPEEPALDVWEDAGFSSHGLSAVPPSAAALELQGHPNPFNPTTTVQYSIGQPGRLVMKIYDLRGQLVRTLLDAEVTEPQGSVIWNGTDDRGRPVVSGVYFVQARAHGRTEVMKMAVIK